MPKYLLLKHYRGGPEPYHPVPPMDQWAPEDVEAHMAFLRHVGELLEENGEYVDAQALTPSAASPSGRSPTPSTSPRRRWRSESAAPSGPCAGAAWTSPANSPSCCASSTSSTRPVTRAG
jgi:hypothetical protein